MAIELNKTTTHVIQGAYTVESQFRQGRNPDAQCDILNITVHPNEWVESIYKNSELNSQGFTAVNGNEEMNEERYEEGDVLWAYRNEYDTHDHGKLPTVFQLKVEGTDKSPDCWTFPSTDQEAYRLKILGSKDVYIRRYPDNLFKCKSDAVSAAAAEYEVMWSHYTRELSIAMDSLKAVSTLKQGLLLNLVLETKEG